MNAPQFKIKSHVTVPLLKTEDGKQYFVKITKAIHRAITNESENKKYENAMARFNALTEEEQKSVDRPQAPNPPELCQVVNLMTGEINQMIVGAVLKSELEREYPNASYVGKAFQIQKAKVQGKRYSAYQIAELELEEEQAEEKPAEAPAKATKK